MAARLKVTCVILQQSHKIKFDIADKFPPVRVGSNGCALQRHSSAVQEFTRP
jgi:hypothetical protein